MLMLLLYHQFCGTAVTKVSPCRCEHMTVSNDWSSGKKVYFFSSPATWRELHLPLAFILCTSVGYKGPEAESWILKVGKANGVTKFVKLQI